MTLAARGKSHAKYRDGRGERPARRDEGEYWAYSTEKQRRQADSIVRRMPRDFHHGLLGTIRNAGFVVGSLMALCTLWVLGNGVYAQSAGGSAQAVRLNPMIEELEQGGIAEGGEVWTFIDMEHRPYRIDQVQLRVEELAAKRKANGQLQSAPMVRVPTYGDESPAWIVKQVLELGALGVIFPSIETKEQALRAVRSMRYPPQKDSKYPNPPGFRGGGPRGGKTFEGLNNTPALIPLADVWPLNPEGELLAMIMIETPEGVKNLDAILDVPGIGAVFIGPTDLGMSYGVGPPRRGTANPLAPETEAAIQTILNACLAKDVVCGIAAGWASPERREELVRQGFRIFL